MKEKDSLDRRFVVDSMLGKVAKWLRVLGFDTRYEWLKQQKQVDVYRSRGVVIITRNRRWCGQPQVICLASNDPVEQFREVVASASIAFDEVRILHRCIVCNTELQLVARDRAYGYVPDYVFETQTTFYQCPGCSRFYWRGSHQKRMMERLRDVLGWIPMTSG